MTVEISIVSTAFNEAGNVHQFLREVRDGANQCGVSYELIFVDDGSTDGTYESLLSYQNDFKFCKIFNNRLNSGLTYSLRKAFSEASGEYIIWIPSDLESDASQDIPKIYFKLLDGYDAVLGERIGRNDGKSSSSFIYNFVSSLLFNTRSRDLNWVKGFRRNVLRSIILRSDWHRYIAHMIYIDGWKVSTVDSVWRPRTYGVSKFGGGRFVKSFLDIISLFFLSKARHRPLQFFGSLSLFTLIIALAISIFLVFLYLYSSWQIRPLYHLSLLLYAVSVQLVFFGLIGELIADFTYSSNHRKN